ncbi:MAG: PIN domain-containing protein, partial [Tangfeifania sp.]
DIKSLKTLHLNHQTENIFLQLLEKYSLSHNLKIPDALIASTAIANETELFTLNKKDFKFIKELNLYQFP